MTHDKQHDNLDDAPEWPLPPFKTAFRRLDEEGKLIHLVFQGFHQITVLPKAIKWLQKTDNEDTKYVEETYAEKIQLAEENADWVQEEIDKDFPILHSHSTVALWSILEVFVEDLATTWLVNKPELWTSDEIASIKLPLGAFHSLDDQEQAKLIIQELSRNSNRGSGATVLAGYLRHFNLTPRIGEDLRKAIHELHQVRNVLVHRGGVGDQKLADECPWLEIASGDKLSISHDIWGWYQLATTRYLERVLDSVIVNLGYEGCNCQGMDTIPDRDVFLSVKDEDNNSDGEKHPSTK